MKSLIKIAKLISQYLRGIISRRRIIIKISTSKNIYPNELHRIVTTKTKNKTFSPPLPPHLLRYLKKQKIRGVALLHLRLLIKEHRNSKILEECLSRRSPFKRLEKEVAVSSVICSHRNWVSRSQALFWTKRVTSFRSVHNRRKRSIGRNISSP